MADIPASTWSEIDASNTTASPEGAPEGMAPGGVNNTMRMMMGAIKRWFDWRIPKTTAGTTTAYTLSYTVAPAALVDGMTHCVQFNATNGAAPTLNVNSLGAIPIHKFSSGAWGAVAAGDLLANSVHNLAYNLAAGSYRVVGSGQPIGAVALGDTNAFTGANSFAVAPTVPTGTAGTGTTAAASQAYADASSAAAVPRSYLSGLGLSVAGGTATFGIAAGVAKDSTNAASLLLASAYTKTGSSWAVGSGNGGIDTGAIANATWYHVYLIERVDTGVVDVIFSTSASAPTLPTNYTLYRRIGSMLTDGSAQWVGFIQAGDLFQWLAPVADISASNPGTSAVTRALTVPLGINVLANVQFGVINVGSGGAAFGYLSDLATTDTAPSGGGVSDVSDASNASGGVTGSYNRISVRTNTSRQIRSRISFSDASVSVKIYTLGWTDRRGRDS